EALVLHRQACVGVRCFGGRSQASAAEETDQPREQNRAERAPCHALDEPRTALELQVLVDIESRTSLGPVHRRADAAFVPRMREISGRGGVERLATIRQSE